MMVALLLSHVNHATSRVVSCVPACALRFFLPASSFLPNYKENLLPFCHRDRLSMHEVGGQQSKSGHLEA